MIYLLDGEVTVNETQELQKNEQQLVLFNQDRDGFSLQGKKKSKLLFLSGVPLKEKIASYGPYVMNDQTEKMEAMRDYQIGKIGFLHA